MKRLIIYSAVPVGDSNFKNFFSTEGPAWKLAKHPPEGHPYGWNLQTLDSGQIEGGDHLVFRNGDRKTIQLFEDGTLIFAASADKDFLGFADDHKPGGIRINSLALIEVTFHFADLFVHLVKNLAPEPKEFSFHITGRNLKVDGETVYLVPSPVYGFGYSTQEDAKFASANEFEVEFNVKIPIWGPTLESGKLAFDLVSKIFAWFGFSVEDIPYVKSEVGIKRIDPASFRPGK